MLPNIRCLRSHGILRPHSSPPLLQALALLPMQTQKLLESPSAHHQSWELELLNVVQWQFLEQQKLTATALPVWPQSRWSQYTLPSPLLLARTSKK
jgi:hypothetical protein